MRRYRWGLGAAVMMMALVGAAEGFTALMVRPVFDRVLKPSSGGNASPLVTLPWNHHTIYLNSFFPSTIHNPWTIFAISLLVIAIVKGIAEFSGTMLVQYIGLAVVTDLRNQIFGKLIRSADRFFSEQPHRPPDVRRDQRCRKGPQHAFGLARRFAPSGLQSHGPCGSDVLCELEDGRARCC